VGLIDDVLSVEQLISRMVKQTEAIRDKWNFIIVQQKSTTSVNGE
jgi:hypothetical protein